jgi:hypothetical protein
MKYVYLIAALLLQLSLSGQKLEFFKGIDFDSSYTIIGIGQGYDSKNLDSLPGFWFLLDNPKDMEKLKQDWVFKSPVPSISIESPNIDIYIIQNKRSINAGGLIFPRQQIITSGQGWYRFDTSRLSALHSEHPFKYHTEKKHFATYNQYAAYGNSIINDSSLLFYNEASTAYGGKFVVISERKSDVTDPMFALKDFTNELKDLAPANSFHAAKVMNDSFEIANPGKVRFTVECSKSLYDKYKSKRFIKGNWEPSPFEMKTFWRDY